MVQDISGCDVKSITNKNSRVTVVSRLNAMGVPPNIGMKLTSHTSIEGYMCYNTNEEGIEMRAFQNCASAVLGTGGEVLWIEALRNEQHRFEESTQQIKTTEQLSNINSSNGLTDSCTCESSFFIKSWRLTDCWTCYWFRVFHDARM